MKTPFEERCDVLVIGSGGAGLTAAAVAASLGADVLVIERTDYLGGTTAISGGRVWVPNNPHQQALGLPDSADDAVGYLEHTTGGRHPAMMRAFVEHGPAMVRWVEANTPHRFYACERYLDYHPQLPGGTLGGRALDSEPYGAADLGAARADVRTSPAYVPLTHREWESWRQPDRYDHDLLRARLDNDTTTGGLALVCALLRGCLDRGVRTRTGTRAVRLRQDAGRVTGAVAETPHGPLRIHARRGVILASGGFEWNADLMRANMAGPVLGLGSPPGNEGDALEMAAQVGATRYGTGHAWWMPMTRIPGETLDGRPFYRSLIRDRAAPGSIIINRAGRRFVNEALPYNEIVTGFQRDDRSNIPAYLVFDQRCRERYAIATVQPGRPTPDWVVRGATLADLAVALDADPAALTATVDHFKEGARQGKDPELGRGESPYDRYYGDPEMSPNPTLAALETPPFYAIEVLPGTIGTKGGLVTDPAAKVLDTGGNPIPGLWACGNTAAFWFDDGYPGPGATIASGMTFGYLAGTDAAGR